MKGTIYVDLVKVFYVNAHIEDGLLVSRIKGVDIVLDNNVWSSIARFKLGGSTPHMGMLGVSKLEVYQSCLHFSNAPRDYTLFKADDRVLTFILAWILVPRKRNHAHQRENTC